MNELIEMPGGLPLACVLLGIALGLCYLLLLCLVHLGAYLWNWIEDEKEPVGLNPLNRRVMRLFGYRVIKREYATTPQYIKGNNTAPGELGIAVVAGVLFLTPAAIAYLNITLVLVAFVVSAHLARFARRTRKLLNAHAADPKAHAAGESK